MDESEPSERVVDQRIRNRIIEYLELVASFDDQLAYERKAPIAHVPYELINQWEDWLPRAFEAGRLPSVFAVAELHELREFQVVWELATSAIPDNYPDLRGVQVLPEWEQLRLQAARALGVFGVRGELSEDREIMD